MLRSEGLFKNIAKTKLYDRNSHHPTDGVPADVKVG